MHWIYEKIMVYDLVHSNYKSSLSVPNYQLP